MLLLSLQPSGKDVYLFLLPRDGCHYLSFLGWRSDDPTFLSEITLSLPNMGLCCWQSVAAGMCCSERLMCMDILGKFKASQ